MMVVRPDERMAATRSARSVSCGSTSTNQVRSRFVCAASDRAQTPSSSASRRRFSRPGTFGANADRVKM